MKQALILFAMLIGLAGLSGCGDRAAERAAEEAAARIRADAVAAEAKARAEAVAASEDVRLAALWTYNETPVGKGTQRTAAILSSSDVETDGTGAKPVQLVFRDHPSWGRSSYLVLRGGDFDCYGSCTLAVTVDDETARKMAGRRPVTDEAIAMFINDARALWRLTAGAKRLSIEFPVKAGGTRVAIFDVAGLDRTKMPRWDGASAPSSSPGAARP